MKQWIGEIGTATGKNRQVGGCRFQNLFASLCEATSRGFVWKCGTPKSRKLAVASWSYSCFSKGRGTMIYSDFSLEPPQAPRAFWSGSWKQMVTGSNPARSLGNRYSAYQKPIFLQAHMNLSFRSPPPLGLKSSCWQFPHDMSTWPQFPTHTHPSIRFVVTISLVGGLIPILKYLYRWFTDLPVNVPLRSWETAFGSPLELQVVRNPRTLRESITTWVSSIKCTWDITH